MKNNAFLNNKMVCSDLWAEDGTNRDGSKRGVNNNSRYVCRECGMISSELLLTLSLDCPIFDASIYQSFTLFLAP